MGRPRRFSDDDVIAAALQTFWQRGYAATSVQDLVDATGLSRASLYGTFGGKDALLKRALETYLARLAPEVRALESAPSVREGLRRFFEQRLASACGSAGPRGCFLVQMAAEGDDAPADAEALAREAETATERVIAQAIKRGKKSGELSARLDERATARMLAVLLQGVAAAARAGTSRAALSAATDQALALLSDA